MSQQCEADPRTVSEEPVPLPGGLVTRLTSNVSVSQRLLRGPSVLCGPGSLRVALFSKPLQFALA